MNEIAPNDFDYSLLDAKTKEFLEERANIIYGIESKSAYEIGKQLAKAQKELSTRATHFLCCWLIYLFLSVVNLTLLL